MRIKLNLLLEVEPLTAERLLKAEPRHLWKMIDLIAANQPQAVTYTVPTVVEEADEKAPPING